MRANGSNWHIFGQPHGTQARARKHYRDGEKPCEACRQAANAARQRYDYSSHPYQGVRIDSRRVAR